MKSRRTRYCPAPGCEAEIARGRLTCRIHWRALPAPLRAAINATWRDRERIGLRAWTANVLEARRLWAAMQ